MLRWIAVANEKEFLKLIDLHSEGMEQALELFLEEKYEEAVEVVAEIYRNRLCHMEVEWTQKNSSDSIQNAENIMENRISLLGMEPEFAGDPIDWVYFAKGDRQWQSHLGYMYFTEHLLRAYEATGEQKYIDKWNKIHMEFLRDHPWGTPDIPYSKKLPMYKNEYLPVVGGEGFCPEYLGGSWISLACASRTGTWIHELSFLAKNHVLETEVLCNMVASLMTDHFSVLLNAPRKGTPNQFMHTSSSMLKLGVHFWEFKNAPAAYLVGMERLEEAFAKCVYDDGSDIEQSFNYNTGLPREFHAIYSGLGVTDNARINRLLEKIRKRCEYLALILDGEASVPDVAKSHHGGKSISQLRGYCELYPQLDLSLVKKIADALENGEDDPTLPRYADFPYGGYSVIRDDWSPMTRYLLFKYSRWSPGHKHEDANSLVLSAFGQEILVDSGNYNYSSDEESERMHTYFYSSSAHNTVDVDGKSQRRMSMEGSLKVDERHPESTTNQAEYKKLQDVLVLHEEECPGVRYHSDHFDLVEGVYSDGYQARISSDQFTGDVVSGKHTRQILFIRECAYIVIDRIQMDDDQQHEFAQYWNYSHTYRPEHFQIDGNYVATKHPEGANLSLWTLGDTPAEIVTVYDQRSPYAGIRAIEYGEMSPSMDLRVLWKGAGQQTRVTVLFPRRWEEETAQVTGNGQQFTADFGNGVAVDFAQTEKGFTATQRIAGGGAYTISFDGTNVTER